jgi:hypothetical protein
VTPGAADALGLHRYVFSEQKKTGSLLQLMFIFPTDTSPEGYSERSIAFVCNSHKYIQEGISVRVTAP